MSIFLQFFENGHGKVASKNTGLKQAEGFRLCYPQGKSELKSIGKGKVTKSPAQESFGLHNLEKRVL